MKLRIEVGEPRNFNAGDGTNVIVAEVVPGLSGSREIEKPPTAATHLQTPTGEKKLDKVTEYWFVVNCNRIVFEDSSFSSLLFIPRYKVKKPPLDILGDGEELVLNGVWRADAEPWDNQSIQDAQKGLLEINGMLVVSARRIADA